MKSTHHNYARLTHVHTRVLSALALLALMAGCSSAARDASVPADPSKANLETPTTTSGASLFSVGGSVSGLVGGGLVLQNNARDNLAIGKDGNFQFATALAKESAYKINVLTQPSAPSQTCVVTQGSGSVVAANITDVAVVCTTNTYTVGGNVTGLSSTSGLVLQINGSNKLSIGANGPFKFDIPITSANPYSVTVLTNPAMPIQTCIVTQGTGTVTDANIDAVAINCTTNAYSVSGSVSGLVGSGLVLQNNKGDNLAFGVPVNSNANFNFAIAVASGNSYNVSVLSQPSSPTQACAVTNASGTIGTSGVTNIAVACTTISYSVSGNVAGLTGSGLVLNNNGTAITLKAGNSFALTLASGKTYNFSVATQPSSPAQVCSVSNGSGTVTSADVSNISVTCSTSAFSVGGSVSGLAVGSSVVLQNNNGDNITVSSNSAFTFVTPVASGAKYSVNVLTQPSSPSQTCTVANGAGNIGNATVTNVAITCIINNFTVGGSITGLSGTGLVLQNNGTDNLTVTANSGNFTFATAVASNAPYSVAVLTQPSNPSQTCSVTGGSGTVTTASITNVSISCTTNTYTVSGSVTGLTGTGLALQNNGADNYPVNANGSFSFTTKIASNGKYAVTVLTPPSGPAQTCSVTNGGGTVSNVNISNVVVNCVTNSYTVSATVTGLNGSGLQLQNNKADSLVISVNGTKPFLTKIASGAVYSVAVISQPSTVTQKCTVTNFTGTVTNADVTVNVNCVTDNFTVSGSVTGLAGSGLALTNNGTPLAVSTGTFSVILPSGSPYSIAVSAQPNTPTQNCVVANGVGTVTNANINNVTVTCSTTSFIVSGGVSGLMGTGLVLTNNGGAPLTLTNNAFSLSLLSGTGYLIAVATQPSAPTQTCTVSTNGTGTVTSANVTNIAVACTTNTYTIGGTITGLTGTGLALQNNLGDSLSVAANSGVFTFKTALASGTNYSVTVLNQPSNPPQTCTVTNGGVLPVTNANITGVLVGCVTNSYPVTAVVTGLVGTGLVLLNNAATPLTNTAAGTYSISLIYGSSYSISVGTPPLGQQCVVAASKAAGTVSILPNTVNVTCLAPGQMGGSIQSTPLNLSNITVKATTFAGVHDGADGAGAAARFRNPNGVVAVGADLYVADTENHTIRKIDAAGNVTTFAGKAGVMGSVDGDVSVARFSSPSGITTYGTFLYVSDSWGIRKIDLQAVPPLVSSITALQIGSAPAAITYYGSSIGGVATDGLSIYVTSFGSHVILKIDIVTKLVSELAGKYRVTGIADGVGTAATFNDPTGITLVGSNLYVTDFASDTIRQVTTVANGAIPAGTVTTVAGTVNVRGVLDGNGTAAQLYLPTGITNDGAFLYVTDMASTVRKIQIGTPWSVTTLAGRRSAGGSADGPGASATFYFQLGSGICVKTGGAALYVADSANNTIRSIDITTPTNTVATLAGTPGASVDGVGAAARFNLPLGVTTDGTSLYVADNLNYSIRKIDIQSQAATTLMDRNAGLSPAQITTDGLNLYFNSYGDIWKMDLVTKVTTLLATVNVNGGITGITTDGKNLYVSDSSVHTIMQIDLSNNALTKLAGVPTTLFGYGSYVDDTTTPGTATFNGPQGLTTNGKYVYVVDSANYRIRQINLATKLVTTLAGTGATLSGIVDGSTTMATFASPVGISSDGGNLYVTDGNTVRVVTLNNITSPNTVTTLSGAHRTISNPYNEGFADGIGASASYNGPAGITNTGSAVYVVDRMNSTIRQLK